MLEDLGWTKGMVGFGFTLHMWVYAIMAIFVGRSVDKFGARWVMVAGAFITLIGMCLLSTVNEVWQFYLFYSVIAAIGVSATYFVPVTVTMRKWFVKRAGLATGIVLAGSGLGIGVITPILGPFISSYGWRTTFVIVGIALGVIGFLSAIILVRKDPESMGLLPDGVTAESTGGEQVASGAVIAEESWSLRQAMHTRTFWCFFLTYCIGGIAGMGLIPLMFDWGLSLGVADVPARLAVLAMAFAAIVSRVVAGPLADRYGKKLFLYIANAGQLVTFGIALTVSSSQGLFAFAILNGLVYGLALPIWAPYLGDIFGRLSVGSLMGMLTFGIGIIGGLGATIWGWIYDTTGSYSDAFLLSMVLWAITLVLIWLIRPVVRKATP
jgi:MFS family permease